MGTAPPSPGLPLGLRVLLGLLGAGAFGTGVVAVFVSDNGPGTGVLVAFGGIALALALLGGRIESFEFGGTRLRLRAAAAERFALAEESERLGNTAEADRLRAQGQAMMAAAGSIAADYRLVRRSMRAGPERTRRMEEVIDRARRLATEERSEGSFDAAEVARWLRHGSEEERVTALAIMQARSELRDFEAALDAIADSRSAFEQYHALRLTQLMLDDLDPDQRRRLGEVVRGVRGLRFRGDTDRWRLSEEILARLG